MSVQTTFTPVSYAEVYAITSDVQAMHGIFASCKASMARFNDLAEPMLRDEIDAAGDSEITGILLADSQATALDRYLQRDVVVSLDQDFDKFRDDQASRPQFDFYAGMMKSLVEQAMTKADALVQTVTSLERKAFIDKAQMLQTPKVICRKPEPESYEPEFGVTELSVLREGGSVGQSVLRRPCTETNIADAEALVDRLSAEWIAQNPVSKPDASLFKLETELDSAFKAWLRAQEREFRIKGAAKRQANSQRALKRKSQRTRRPMAIRIRP